MASWYCPVHGERMRGGQPTHAGDKGIGYVCPIDQHRWVVVIEKSGLPVVVDYGRVDFVPMRPGSPLRPGEQRVGANRE